MTSSILSSLISISLLASILIQLAFATPTATTAEACKAIEKAIPKKVFYPGASSYTKETKDYWNVAIRDLKPACICMPETAEDVSQIIKTLGTFPEVKFAVKSGGHDPNAGHSSIDDGVLIALKKIKGTKNDRAKGVALVKPGGPWSDVVSPLYKDGVTVVGGRLGIVGIGGYITQGGVSFLSAQYGMSADNVVEYEVVQPNGTIAIVNQKNNPALMTAMRGSGDQFGIVTQFTLKTYKIGKVWGGYRLYGPGKKDAVFTALHAFIGKGDPKAAIICDHEQALGGTAGYMIFFFYDGEKPPPGVFAGFEDIPSTLDFCKTRTYPELLNFNARGADMTGSRTSFRSITLPYLANEPGYYAQIQAIWERIAAPTLKTTYGALFTIAFQPFVKSIGVASARNGGNALGFSENDQNRFVLEMNCVWWNREFDKTIYDISKQLTEAITQLTKELTSRAGAGQFSEYNPLFMNDAFGDQDVIGSYKDKDKFAALQKQIDPTGLFANRAGSFRYGRLGSGSPS